MSDHETGGAAGGGGGREGKGIIELVTTKSDAEIAADLKARFEEAIKPALAILDQARDAGLVIQFDALGLQPPLFRNYAIIGLRVVKHF